MRAASIFLISLFCLALPHSHAQFKGGSLHWERLSPDSNVVRVTLRTSWIRSSNTFVKIVDGVAQPSENFQPVKGDIVNVLGYETPKFVFSTGFESYLQLEVTSNTEAVNDQYDHNAGQNLPHTNNHWSHNASNWIDGIASWDIELPDPDQTYIAEIQGCCRDQEWDGFNIRYARGLRDMFSTPYHLSSIVRLDLDPPPLSFLPFFVPFQTQQSAQVLKLTLPILDYRATASGSVGSRDEREPENWVNMIHAAGDTHVSDEPVDLNPLYPIGIPAPVIATASITGTSVRLLKNAQQYLKLFGASSECAGPEYVELPPGSDLCEDSGFAELKYPSGEMVRNNISAVMVPAGLMVEVTDGCEFSQPPQGSHRSGTFAFGTVRKTCMEGCCALSKEEMEGAVMFRTRTIASTEASIKILITPVKLENGFFQLELEGGALAQGNFPVTLKLATNTSAWTMVEFTLHVMNSIGQSIAGTSEASPLSHNPSPVGFAHAWTWDLAPDTFQIDRKFFFDNLGQRALFGGEEDKPSAGLTRESTPRRWELTWTPCNVHRGYYYYCVFGLSAEPPYDWAPMQCAFINVVGDKPPRLSMRLLENSTVMDQVDYSLYMGQRLEAVVEVMDNPSDSILFLGVSKVDVNTGDKYRARVAYVYEDVSTDTQHEIALMPLLVEPDLPPFLSLSIGGPTNQTFTTLNPHTYDRVLSFVPTRMHSALVFTLCFLAVDARGACPRELPGKDRVGSGTERCMRVSVHRCKYAMGAGQDLPYVAGLFETSWIQLFVLNPLISSPEVAVTDERIINVGHLHQVGAGQYLDTVARRFGTSMRELTFINVDLAERNRRQWEMGLQVGTELCVLPNSCTTNV